MSDSKQKKPKKVYGTYRANRTETECRRAQLVRTILYAAANALLVVMLFVPAASLEYLHGVTWLNTLYILVILLLVATAVYASVFAARRGKFAPEISAKYAPRRGLDSVLTFASLELDCLLRLGWAALQIYATVKAFDGAGSALAVIAVASAALSLAGRTYTAHFYRGHVQFIPPASPEKPAVDETEDFYAPVVAIEEQDGGTDAPAPAAIPDAPEDVEDFYGDGE